MGKNVQEAERELKRACRFHHNMEVPIEEKEAAYNKAISKAPKNSSIIGRAIALKAEMYLLSYNLEKNPKIKADLLKKAAKFSKEAAQDSNNLLGIYVDSKVRHDKGELTEEGIAPIIAKIRESEANSWSDHSAKMYVIRKDGGNEAKLEYIKKLLAKPEFKDDFRVHYAKGYAAYFSDQYDIAIEAFKKVIELEPRMLNAYLQLALSYGYKASDETDTQKYITLLQQKKEKLIEYRKAKTEDGLNDDDSLLSHLCLVHFTLKEFPDFIREAEKAKAVFPTEAWSFAIMGMAYSHKSYRTVIAREQHYKASMEAFENAQQAFRKNEKIASDSLDIALCKAYALEHFDKSAEALEYIDYALKIIFRSGNKEGLKEISEVSELIGLIFGEKIDQLRKQKDMDIILIENPVDLNDIDLRADYNVQVIKVNKKANELIESKEDVSAYDTCLTMLSYSARAKLEAGKANIIELQGKSVELKSSDAAAYSYFCGFYGTLKSAYEAAMQYESKGFEIDMASKVSLASSFLTLMPFDKKVAKAALKDDSGFISKKKPFDVMYKFLDAKPEYEFASMAGQLSLNVTYAKQQKNLSKNKAKIEKRYGNWVKSFNKAFKEDVANELYNDPNKLEGHTDAVALLKEIYIAKNLVQKTGVNFAKSMEVFAIGKIIGSSSPSKDYDGTFKAALKEVSGLVDHFAE